jgi:hypothetical protein
MSLPWAYLLPLFLAPIVAASNAVKVSVIADGFSWVENLAMDGLGNIFVSDRTRGSISRLHFNATSGVFQKDEWVAGFSLVLGLTINPASPGVMYAVGEDSGNRHFVIAIDTTSGPHSPVRTVIPDLGKGVGNGLGIHFATGYV